MDSIAEVVLCIESLKLKKKYFSSHISVCCSGQYISPDEVPYSTTVRPFVAGEVYGVPLVDSLQGVLVTVYSENKDSSNGLNRSLLGSALVSLRSHISSSFSRIFELNVLQETVVIGKLIGKAALYTVKAADENKLRGKGHRKSGSHSSDDESPSRDQTRVVQPVRSHPLREFCFSPLNKRIDWDRIANIDLKRVARSGNIPHFDHVRDHVSYGDARSSAYNCDPKLGAALQALQLSAQYIGNCSEVLQAKQVKVAEAIECFRKEEQLLDRELRRRKTKTKGLKTKMSGYDQLHSDYLSILNQLNPAVARDYILGVREQERAAQDAAAQALARGRSGSRGRGHKRNDSDSGSGSDSAASRTSYSDSDSDDRRRRRHRRHRDRDRDRRSRERSKDRDKSWDRGDRSRPQDDINFIVSKTATVAAESSWRTASAPAAAPVVSTRVTAPPADADEVQTFEPPPAAPAAAPAKAPSPKSPSPTHVPPVRAALRPGPTITHIQLGHGASSGAANDSDSDELEVQNFDAPDNANASGVGDSATFSRPGHPPLKPAQHSSEVPVGGAAQQSSSGNPLAASTASMAMSMDSLSPDYVEKEKELPRGAPPGSVPGAVPGAPPGTVPGAVPGAPPGSVPGAIPGGKPVAEGEAYARVPTRRESTSAAFKLANQRRNHTFDDDDDGEEDQEELKRRRQLEREKKEKEEKDAAMKHMLQQRKEKRELELRLLQLKKEKEDLLRAQEQEELRVRESLQSTDSLLSAPGPDDVQSMDMSSSGIGLAGAGTGTGNANVNANAAGSLNESVSLIDTSNSMIIDDDASAASDAYTPFSSDAHSLSHTHGSTFSHGMRSQDRGHGFANTYGAPGGRGGSSSRFSMDNSQSPARGPVTGPAGGIDLRGIRDRPGRGPGPGGGGGIDLRRVVEHQPVPAPAAEQSNSLLMESMTDSFEYPDRSGPGATHQQGQGGNSAASTARALNDVSGDDGSSAGLNNSSFMEYSQSQSQSHGQIEGGMGMHTGVLNYLHHKHGDGEGEDEGEGRSLELRPPHRGRGGDDDDDGDVLLGTVGGRSGLGFTGTDTYTGQNSSLGMTGDTLGSSMVQSLGSDSLSSSQYDAAVLAAPAGGRRMPSMPALAEDEPFTSEDYEVALARPALQLVDEDGQEVSPLSTMSVTGTTPPPTYTPTQPPEPEPQPQPQPQSLVGWSSGRAPMENVEVGQALDVNINAVRMYPAAFLSPQGRSPSSHSGASESLICVYCEFLGAGSKVSKEYAVNKPAGAAAGAQNRMGLSGSGAFTVQANYSCHMLFESRSALALLAEEIENETENICLNVVVTMTTSTSTEGGGAAGMAESTSVETTLVSGIARIPLYTMIENSCHIIRHEVDIIRSAPDQQGGDSDEEVDRKQSVIGSIVIDVRGYQLLEQCS